MNTLRAPRPTDDWSDTLVLVYYGRSEEWLPKPPRAFPIEYTSLMNTNETTMTATLDTVRVMSDWFTALSTDLQGDITEMVNEAGYPLDDIRDFIEVHGAQAYADGHYVTWCRLEEECGAYTEAIEAFVDEFGIDAIESFEDAYVGHYGSEAEFAEEYTSACYSAVDNLPAHVVIDWQATWDSALRYDFTYNNGYVFHSNW